MAANSATSAAVCGNEDAGAGTSCSRHSSYRPRLLASRPAGRPAPWATGTIRRARRSFSAIRTAASSSVGMSTAGPGIPPPGFLEPLDHPLRIGALLRRPDVVTAAVPGQRRGRPPILRHGIDRHPEPTERPDRVDAPVVQWIVADLHDQRGDITVHRRARSAAPAAHRPGLAGRLRLTLDRSADPLISPVGRGHDRTTNRMMTTKTKKASSGSGASARQRVSHRKSAARHGCTPARPGPAAAGRDQPARSVSRRWGGPATRSPSAATAGCACGGPPVGVDDGVAVAERDLDARVGSHCGAELLPPADWVVRRLGEVRLLGGGRDEVAARAHGAQGGDQAGDLGGAGGRELGDVVGPGDVPVLPR